MASGSAAVERLASADAAHAWLVARGARRLVGDSRRVGADDAFLAWPGRGVDARRFVADALAAGARACLVEAEGIEGWRFASANVAAIDDLKRQAGEIASRFLDRPSERLDVVAVTGTNGKTSTAWWIAQALTAAGRRCGFVGTLGVGEPSAATATPLGGFRATGLTTPDPIELQSALRDFVERGAAACAIEASSIGIVESRLSGTTLAVAVLTNFSQDHLDYHGDMATYWEAKARLFAWPGLRAAVVNVDDPRGAELVRSLDARGVECWTTSLEGGARLVAGDIRHEAGGLAFAVREGAATARLSTPLVGAHNVANLLAAFAVLRALGIAFDAAATACRTVTPVPGRMERVTVVANRQTARAAGRGRAGAATASALAAPLVLVDYAHTPDALEKALSALVPLARERGGRLWCVFGCGGNRDAGKRPLMGAVACRFADRVVLTSDNPRLEAPDFILAQILAGVVGHDEVDVIENRAEAIRHALTAAAPADVVLIAGKGHEDTQDAGGVKRRFVDADEAAQALHDRFAGAADAARLATTKGDVTTPITMTTLGELARLVPAARLVGDPATPIARVHSDTRTLRPGDLFVALHGERFDAHSFLAAARDAGAVAALAERGIAEAGLAGLEVADAKAALGALAAAWRVRFDMPLVAVAGSNGKTTVTQMIAAIFRAGFGAAAFATEGNFNNDIGVPLTLLRLRDANRAGVAVVELGMNHPGEIARLAAMARPTVALVNNAQREHLEFMRDVAAVAAENGAAIEALGADGVAVFPADDAHASTWAALAGARRTLTFALRDDDDADGSAAGARFASVEAEAAARGVAAGSAPVEAGVAGRDAAIDAVGSRRGTHEAVAPEASSPARPMAEAMASTALDGAAAFALSGAAADVEGRARWAGDCWQVDARTPLGPLSFELHAAGRHNVRNALAAATAAIAAGSALDAIARGLEAFAPVKGRSHVVRGTLGGRTFALVDDSYNANPDSVRAAIEVLAAMPAPRWLVLGDMGEVGDQGPAFHREAGAYAAERGIDSMWAAGPQAAQTLAGYREGAGRAFADVPALIAALAAAPDAASVLVKGSRFMAMERVVGALGAGAAGDGHAA